MTLNGTRIFLPQLYPDVATIPPGPADRPEPLYTDGDRMDAAAMYDFSALKSSMERDMFLDLSAFTIVLITLYSVVFIVGLLGNVLVIMVIVKFQSMRTLTNVFLANLTVGDLLVICVCVPITLGNRVYGNWIYGDVLCKATPFIQGSAVSVSVLSLLAISTSRYFAIHKPLTAKIIFSRRNVRIMLVAIWTVSFAAFSPLLALNSVTTYGVPGLFEGKTCVEHWPVHNDKNVYNVFIFCLLFVWPFSLMGVAYVVIGHTLWNGNAVLFNPESRAAGKKSNVILRQRRRTVKMLLCVIGIFGVCWLPYYIVNLWIDFNLKEKTPTTTDTMVQTEAVHQNEAMLDYPQNEAEYAEYGLQNQVVAMETVTQYVFPLVQMLGLANSLVNPLCYYFLSNGFRRAFRKVFCPKFIRKRGSVLSFLRLRTRSTSGSESMETTEC